MISLLVNEKPRIHFLEAAHRPTRQQIVLYQIHPVLDQIKSLVKQVDKRPLHQEEELILGKIMLWSIQYVQDPHLQIAKSNLLQ